MNTKVYFFPDDDINDAFFGSASPVCVTREEVDRLAREWDDPDLMDHMHEATAEELEEYGTEED